MASSTSHVRHHVPHCKSYPSSNLKYFKKKREKEREREREREKPKNKTRQDDTTEHNTTTQQHIELRYDTEINSAPGIGYLGA